MEFILIVFLNLYLIRIIEDTSCFSLFISRLSSIMIIGVGEKETNEQAQQTILSRIYIRKLSPLLPFSLQGGKEISNNFRNFRNGIRIYITIRKDNLKQWLFLLIYQARCPEIYIYINKKFIFILPQFLSNFIYFSLHYFLLLIFEFLR